jgi:hypothetical protein
MTNKTVMRWTDGRGRECVREVNQVLDIREFKGTPGYALLVCAANGHLSIAEILMFLYSQGVERGENWVRRRRWLFQPPGTVNRNTAANTDGKDERAIEVIREYPSASLRYVVQILKERGIKRGKDWVREQRSS